ncbi:MAG: DUF354 domain-containing protein [Dehalococcoidia bacterium]|nr:DUF354 domain-containing protein [Dehalococcoidia bacterium]
MKILFCIATPAQVHFWRYSIESLVKKGHKVKILARDYESTLELLDRYGLEYSSFKPIRSKYLKIFELLTHALKGYGLGRKFHSDIILGFGVGTSSVSALLRKPCIVFTDTESLPVQHFLTKVFATVIITPSCFRGDLGKRHIRIAGYKELAYLHPNYFHADPTIYDELGISKDEKYVILRFNAFDAVHDIGRRGFSLLNKYQLARGLGKYARVFLSAEGRLPEDLESFKLPIPYHLIHHALYYAKLVICDTGTIATEAATLGTPSIYCSSAAGQFGNFVELQQKYDLIYCFREPKRAIEKALELIQQPDLKEQWAKKRQRLLADRIDVTQFIVWLIENYPESFEEYRRSQANKH